MNMFKKTGGFTLVELIVVIAILAILAGVAIPAYSGYINSANEAADTTALASIKTAAVAACATEGAVSALTVTIADSGNTIDITCGAKVFKLKYDNTNKLWIDAAPDNNQVVEGEDNVIKDFNAFISKANITLKTGNAATWSGTEWEIE